MNFTDISKFPLKCPACGISFNYQHPSHEPQIRVIQESSLFKIFSKKLPEIYGFQFGCYKCNYRWYEMNETR